MDEARRRFRFSSRWTGGAVFVALCVGLWLAYRWAEPPRSRLYPPSSPGPTVAIRMENAPFVGYSQGVRTWELKAKTIELERAAGAAPGNIQSATLTGITNGVMYKVDTVKRSIPESPVVFTSQDKARNRPPIAAIFRAGRGHYAPYSTEAIPPEISPTYYNVQWQLRLSDTVDFRTTSGDRLQAPSLVVLALFNRRTGIKEQRILCDEGATVTRKGMKIQANRIRYDPASRTAECLGGVRGTFGKGTVQAERAFLTLKDEVLRCPEEAAGTIGGMPFQLSGLTLDMRRRRLSANRGVLQLRMDEKSDEPNL